MDTTRRRLPIRVPFSASKAAGSRSRRLSAGRVVIELAIVFFGVYAAFALAENQKQREVAERSMQIRDALVREMVDITGNTRRVANELSTNLVVLDSLIMAGARPPLVPMIEPIRVEAHMWEATLRSGGLELLDVETIYRLSNFYNQLNAGFEQLAQLRSLSETVLIPNLGRGAEEFYDPESGRLLPKYRWYIEGLTRLRFIAADITMLGDDLVADLSR